jgi:hypothetical protein
MSINKEQLRKSLEELDRFRGELILAKYRYEEALEDFDNLYGRGAGDKAIRTLRSRALLKKLVLTREALDSMTEELFDTLVQQRERDRERGRET